MSPALDDFELDQTLETPTRTITGSMVEAFADLSGDDNPLHTDAEAAAEGMFGERVAHGMLVASVVTGLWMETGLEGVVLAGIDGMRFVAPVAFGDTIRAELTVTDLEDRGEHGIVVLRNEVLDQDGETVLVFDARLAVEKDG